MDEVVFPTMTEIMETFGKLVGRVQILDLPIDEAGLKAWLSRQQGGDLVQAARTWASQYKARQHETRKR
jgi:hypothetical protein